MAISDLIEQTIAQHIIAPKVLSYAPSKLNEVTGRFVSANRVYNFVLNKDGVSYSPAGQNDSLLFSALYLRQDAVRKPKVGNDKCNAGKSYQCGKICLGNGRKCHKGVRDVNDARRIASILESTNEKLKGNLEGSDNAKARGRALFEARGNRVENGKAIKEKEQIISSKSSTGDVVKVGDKVYKNTLLANGKQTLEGEVFESLKGVEGIANGRSIVRNGKEQIETPFYKHMISTDDIPKKDREYMSNIVSENADRINRAVATLSDAGYAYNDPLQFGYANGKMDLLDFSNASKPTDKYRDVVGENYSALAQFYKEFGLEKQGNTVLGGVRMLSNLKSNENESEVNSFLDDDEIEKLNQVRASGVKARNVYYSRNARSVQLRNVGQTDMGFDDNVKYVFSEKPLSEKDMADWELKAIFEQKRTIP